MHILSNIHDRNYWETYPEIENIVFDINDKLLKNKKNKDWFSIKEGSIVCVIMSSRKVSTFYKVTSTLETDSEDEAEGKRYALLAEVVAKFEDREDMTRLFNKYEVAHESLSKNKIGVGFNVADIGDGLDELPVKIANGSTVTIAELKASTE